MKNVTCWRRYFSICLCLCVILLAGNLFSQDYRATVQGTVVDASHAAVPSAKVTLSNVGTGVATTQNTDDSGHYLFDFVQPGAYRVTVEASGFQKFVQENVTVLTRGDVTVNATLGTGSVSEVVNVTAAPDQLQFNTSTMTTTVQGEALKNIPVLARNPYTLTLLNPAVVNDYWDVSHRNPFYMWSSGGLDVGGATGGKNDQELDGVSLNISARGSYNAPMDAVQEVSVQQNSMDAEFGFSAGGTLNLSMKSGTNEYHGTAYYFGRNPALNAMTNRITREDSVVRNHIWGGTIGNPILKNKLFNFFVYEQWKSTQPASNQSTVPTDLERAGDFSHSLTPQGGLRVIYDPMSTIFNPATSTVTRTPFPGNIVPKAQMDPGGVRAVNDLWKPNRPGNDLSGANNFENTYAWWIKYWNISDRVDYNISDKWRMYARFSKYQTRLDNPNWGDTIAVPSDNGGIMDAMNSAMDVLWMVSPRTTIDFRYGATYVEDDYDSGWAKVPESEWANFFPNAWYTPVLAASPAIYYPNFNYLLNGSSVAHTGFGSWWQVHGRSHNPTVNVTMDRGIHHMKAGWQLRYSYDRDGAPGPGGFNFDSIDTASSYLGYDPTQSGSVYASALLGVMNGGTARIDPVFDTAQQQWGFYFQDDIKLTRNLTLNLGMRYELETAPLEDQNRLVQQLNLAMPLPALANNPPQMPSEVTSIANIPYSYNGTIVFANGSDRRMYMAPKATYLPRAGLALRLNDKTVLRTGWARYAVPMVAVHPEGGGIPTYGFSQDTPILGPLQGVPRAFLSDPFPASNPIQLPKGTSLGDYTEVGNSVYWWNQSLHVPINDRINLSVQRQAPFGFFTEGTFFMNFGHDVQDPSMWGGNYGFNMNQVDPNLVYKYKGAIDQSVANPFYGMPANIVPGSLGIQPEISVRNLLRPYPQYGDLTEYAWPGVTDHYYALQLSAERPMSHGFYFLLAYNYNHEYHSQYFNDIDTYNNKFTMMDRGNPRHSLRAAGTWEVPVGRGRQFLSNANRFVDAFLGGWSTSSLWMFNSGGLLMFGQADVSGDPRQNVPSGYYFNPSVFAVSGAYTPRTNPWYYNGLRGPSFWSLDSTVSKDFPITERVKLEFRMEFYNMPNIFMPSSPDTGIGSGTMGQSTWVAGGNYGREIQYTARIHF